MPHIGCRPATTPVLSTSCSSYSGPRALFPSCVSRDSTFSLTVLLIEIYFSGSVYLSALNFVVYADNADFTVDSAVVAGPVEEEVNGGGGGGDIGVDILESGGIWEIVTDVK